MLPSVAGADEADAHYRAGLAFKQQDKTDEAIQEFLEAIKLRNDYAAAEFSLGVTYKMRNQLQTAADHLEKAAKLQPKTADAHASLGMTYYSLGKHRRRHRASSTRRWSSTRTTPRGSRRSARSTARRRTTERPSRTWRRRCMLDPKDADALSNLGVAYRQTNKIAEAEKYFQKALELKPDQADIHFNLGVVYRRQSKTQEAIAEYEKAIELDDRTGRRPLRPRRDAGAAEAQRRSHQRVEPLPRPEGAAGSQRGRRSCASTSKSSAGRLD